MPQMLQCYKCATQNPLGMRFCTTCGEKFIYKCPQCNYNIEPGCEYCSGCSARLDWGTKTKQTTGDFPEPDKLAESKQVEEKEYETKEKDQAGQRKKSPWLIAFIIIVLLIIAIFALDTMSSVLFTK